MCHKNNNKNNKKNIKNLFNILIRDTKNMSEQNNIIQNKFMDMIINKKIPVAIFLISGIKLQGYVDSYDDNAVVLKSTNGKQMIYKHAISTIVPMSDPFDVN